MPLFLIMKLIFESSILLSVALLMHLSSAGRWETGQGYGGRSAHWVFLGLRSVHVVGGPGPWWPGTVSGSVFRHLEAQHPGALGDSLGLCCGRHCSAR